MSIKKHGIWSNGVENLKFDDELDECLGFIYTGPCLDHYNGREIPKPLKDKHLESMVEFKMGAWNDTTKTKEQATCIFVRRDRVYGDAPLQISI